MRRAIETMDYNAPEVLTTRDVRYGSQDLDLSARAQHNVWVTHTRVDVVLNFVLFYLITIEVCVIGNIDMNSKLIERFS